MQQIEWAMQEIEILNKEIKILNKEIKILNKEIKGLKEKLAFAKNNRAIGVSYVVCNILELLASKGDGEYVNFADAVKEAKRLTLHTEENFAVVTINGVTNFKRHVDFISEGDDFISEGEV